jgi:hypothetical protein
MATVFISGHLDLTPEEFEAHYRKQIDKAIQGGCDFVVGDARGADAMAQVCIASYAVKSNKPYDIKVTVYHAFETPRNHHVGNSRGGFSSQNAKDKAMTLASDFDIAWVRPGREQSGTARNIERRKKLSK